jgi:hypothetical protein
MSDITIDDDETPTKFTKKSLKARGWTDAMMRDLLPEPIITEHSWGRQSWETHEYLSEVVVAAESGEGFATRLEVARLRSAKTKATAKARATALIAEMDSIELNLPDPMSWDELVFEAVNHYNALWADRSRKWADVNDSEEFLTRISANYLRHNRTNYESILEANRGKPGTADAYDQLRIRLDQEIDGYIDGCKSCAVVEELLKDLPPAYKDFVLEVAAQCEPCTPKVYQRIVHVVGVAARRAS